MHDCAAACVMQGYTIPLDKRLAADGRGMQEETINRKHMGLAHALYAAELTARRESELQARLQNEIKQRQKQRKEEQLRALAAQARMGGISGAVGGSLASRLDDGVLFATHCHLHSLLMLCFEGTRS
jgi:SNW domain-containing protein 1